MSCHPRCEAEASSTGQASTASSCFPTALADPLLSSHRHLASGICCWRIHYCSLMRSSGLQQDLDSVCSSPAVPPSRSPAARSPQRTVPALLSVPAMDHWRTSLAPSCSAGGVAVLDAGSRVETLISQQEQSRGRADGGRTGEGSVEGNCQRRLMLTTTVHTGNFYCDDKAHIGHHWSVRSAHELHVPYHILYMTSHYCTYVKDPTGDCCHSRTDTAPMQCHFAPPV